MPCQTISQGHSSHSKLEGVYNRRQPGSSPHPALKHRQQQRNELRRSASLVLAKNQRGTCDAMDGPLPPFADWVTDPSRHSTSAQGKSRGSGSDFLEDLPPRLEDCLQRLAAADRELERCRNQQAYSMSSPANNRYRAARSEEPVMAAASSLQRQDSGGVSADGASAAARESPSRAGSSQQLGKPKPGTPQQPDNKPFSSGSVGIGEPAPEPPMANNVSFSGLDIPLDADFDDYADGSDKEGDQLGGGPSVIAEDLTGSIEEALLELDSKWQAVDRERTAVQSQRDDLAGRLSASEAREGSLDSQLRTLDAKLQEATNDIQVLRKKLGVSEQASQALKTRIGDLESREDALQIQANQLTTQLSASHSEVEKLTADLVEVETSRDLHQNRAKAESEAHAEKAQRAAKDQESTTRRAEVAEKALEEAQAALAAERHIREQSASAAAKEASQKAIDLETEGQRLAAREKKLEKELAAARERTRVAEEEMEAMRVAKDEALKARESRQEEAQAKLVAPPDEAAALENADSFDIFSMEAMGIPSLAAIPSLLFAADMPPATEACDGEQQDFPTLLPTQCMVDLMSNEIRLQTLTPIGPTRRVKLQSIDSITRPESPSGTVDLELVDDSAAAPHTLQRLRLRAVDEHCASALIAAISMPNRVMPGGMLGSPPGEEAQGH